MWSRHGVAFGFARASKKGAGGGGEGGGGGGGRDLFCIPHLE